MLFSDPTDDNGMMQIFNLLNNYMKLFKTIPAYFTDIYLFLSFLRLGTWSVPRNGHISTLPNAVYHFQGWIKERPSPRTGTP